ncbi:MAG TPA: group 1 truncated hemoglobin [Blastocatellia bacterium]|nr:group 1 truncated hemoglobin [Blastocatellia bacterium]
MKRRIMLHSLMTIVLLLSTLAPHRQAEAGQSGDTLYKRLGGYDAVVAVVDDFIGRLASDKEISRFLVGLSTDSKKRLRQLVIDQICAATGGPCLYTGRDMKTSHSGLGISESEWDAAAKHLVATLNKFKVPKKEQDELMAIVSTLKGDIVEKK